MSLATKPNTGLFEIVQAIYREEGGLKGFTTGLVPNLIMVVNPVIYFVLYENAKGAFSDVGPVKLFVISSLSKTCATFTTYPVLTLRVRL